MDSRFHNWWSKKTPEYKRQHYLRNKARQDAWVKANPERVKAAKRRYENKKKVPPHKTLKQLAEECQRSVCTLWNWRKLGVTLEDVVAQFVRQNGCCLICKLREDPSDSLTKLHLDHNHQTGAVRGFLCGRCNTGLGMFREDPDTLERAKQYLLDDKPDYMSVGGVATR